MNNKDWELFKKSVSPLKGQKRLFLGKKKATYQSNLKTIEDDLELMDTSVSEDWGSLEKNILKKIQKGRIKISDTLDLHGSNINDSKKLVFEFINQNFEIQNRLLLLITGKGKRVFVGDKWTGTGKLKTKIPIWLNSIALSKKIIWFDYAPPNRGGEGAFLVYLRKIIK